MLLRINGRLEVNYCALSGLFSGVRLKPLSCTAFLHFPCLIAAVAELLDNAVDEVFRIFTVPLHTLDHSGLDSRLNYVS
jgi:hypothetical protein